MTARQMFGTLQERDQMRTELQKIRYYRENKKKIVFEAFHMGMTVRSVASWSGISFGTLCRWRKAQREHQHQLSSTLHTRMRACYASI